MFGFLHASSPRSPSEAICRAIGHDGLPPVGSPMRLSVVESRGRYLGRKVTFVRVFDSARAAQRALPVTCFHDLDSHPSLILWSGHVERDGTVVIVRCPHTVRIVHDTVRPAPF